MATPERPHWTPTEGEVRIFDPQYVSFSYGPGNDIQFGPKGGFPEHVWIGPGDHPMLDPLFAARPDLIVGSGEAAEVYPCVQCPPGPDGKYPRFASERALRGHINAKHKSQVLREAVGGSAPALVETPEA